MRDSQTHSIRSARVSRIRRGRERLEDMKLMTKGQDLGSSAVLCLANIR